MGISAIQSKWGRFTAGVALAFALIMMGEFDWDPGGCEAHYSVSSIQELRH